jgi:hypothetical protein
MTKKPKRNDLDSVVETILKDNDDIHVVVNPMVWHPGDGGREWWFSVSVSKRGEWFSIGIEDPDYEPPGRLDDALAAAFDTIIEIRKVDARSRVISALLGRKPIVVHRFDDELDAARCCERFWPGERITKVRKAIELEREQWAKERAAS